jgi:tartrate-resistant acid phosphatase type 5
MNKVLLAASLLLPALAPAQTDLGHVLPSERALHVLAIGDYGSGSPHQAAVARAIRSRHEEAPFDLGVTVGDNFYRCGVHSVKDENWKRRFEDLYSVLHIQIYASLGNHDYGHPPVVCPARAGSPDAEVAYTTHSDTWRMPARYYTFAAGAARFFAIDTEGWSEKQFEWLRKVLADSQNEPGVKWRIVYGHHPMYTSGAHENERRIGELRELLTPVFKENHVDLYLAGHDHDMEHLRKDGIEYVVCGASGAELRKPGHTQPESIFHATTYGFTEFTIDDQHLAFRFYDTDLHSLEDPEPVVRK